MIFPSRAYESAAYIITLSRTYGLEWKPGSVALMNIDADGFALKVQSPQNFLSFVHKILERGAGIEPAYASLED